ncbi:unnamed protein product [Caenorhabditis auriculariae]|uniref:Cation efflux protein cytoplasmic domain-containing protein n=1 Tax=Caenorhabditis auriculariae TaxID=2777116 RepID=A0A8S1HNF9_9PELO|nr:unnamed protein product [Caenorhabditis auriculariae]
MSEKQPLLPTAKKLKSTNGCWWTRWKRKRAKKKYYRHLDSLLKLYEQDSYAICGKKKEPQKKDDPYENLLDRVSLLLKLILVASKLSASYLSNSLAITSVFVDSLMDVCSEAILGVCMWLIENIDTFSYPRGRARLTTIGVILSSIVLGVANMAILMRSISDIVTGTIDPSLENLSLFIILGGLALNGILMVLCYRKGSEATKVLAMDARNDMVNSLVGLTAAVIANNFWIYADPLGAVIVCGLIAISWFRYATKYIPKLVGIRVERETLSRILKIAIEHDDRIRCVDHIMVYHTGVDALVELDVVLDDDMPLKISHDVTHPLEKKLCRLDFVEKAFVHCDYRCDGDSKFPPASNHHFFLLFGSTVIEPRQ